MARIGRPPMFNNCMDLDAMCELYFEQCDENDEPYLLSGLPLFLGFSDRASLYDLEDKPEFSRIVKRARLRVEAGCEGSMMKDKSNPTKYIFKLKQIGWKDRVDVEANATFAVNINVPEESD